MSFVRSFIFLVSAIALQFHQLRSPVSRRMHLERTCRFCQNQPSDLSTNEQSTGWTDNGRLEDLCTTKNVGLYNSTLSFVPGHEGCGNIIDRADMWLMLLILSGIARCDCRLAEMATPISRAIDSSVAFQSPVGNLEEKRCIFAVGYCDGGKRMMLVSTSHGMATS